MTAVQSTAPVPAATDAVAVACLQVPAAGPLAALQARLVDRIKRAATRQLHASPGGERLMLRIYHAGEEASQQLFHKEIITGAPPWLQRQLRQHQAEEEGHTKLFADALAAHGAARGTGLSPTGLSQRKIARWTRLRDKHAAHFGNGSVVTLYAILMCAEQMAMRIMDRHCDTIGAGHPLFPLFSRVLADEVRHVRLCAHTLQRLVAEHEAAPLVALLADIRSIETRFGVTGALGMYAAGLAYRALAALGVLFAAAKPQ